MKQFALNCVQVISKSCDRAIQLTVCKQKFLFKFVEFILCYKTIKFCLDYIYICYEGAKLIRKCKNFTCFRFVIDSGLKLTYNSIHFLSGFFKLSNQLVNFCFEGSIFSVNRNATCYLVNSISEIKCSSKSCIFVPTSECKTTNCRSSGSGHNFTCCPLNCVPRNTRSNIRCISRYIEHYINCRNNFYVFIIVFGYFRICNQGGS